MVHVFEYHEKHYIYDTGSGSLHECDGKTAEYLKGNVLSFTDEELKEILTDVNALKEQNLLFAEEVKTYPLKSNEVKACISATIATCAAVTALQTKAPITTRAK